MSGARIHRRPGVLWRRSLDAVVVMAPGHEVVTLGGTGPTLWDLLAEWRTLDQLVESLAAAYGAAAGQIATDLAPILGDLEAAGAILVAADSGGPEGG